MLVTAGGGRLIRCSITFGGQAVGGKGRGQVWGRSQAGWPETLTAIARCERESMAFRPQPGGAGELGETTRPAGNKKDETSLVFASKNPERTKDKRKEGKRKTSRSRGIMSPSAGQRPITDCDAG